MIHNIIQLIHTAANKYPQAIALKGVAGPPATYTQLVQQVEYVKSALQYVGIKRNDKIAVVMPNGPEMAMAFLTVASAATCAPLNPGYKYSEFEFYISDLQAKALIVPEGLDSPARKVAAAQNIPIIEITADINKGAGMFTFTSIKGNLPPADNFVQADDIALVLHTSGTTSRPKIVPLTHQNIFTSASNIQHTLQLTAEDSCLNIMPLFHIHGLIGAVLSSICAGGTIVCTPGFDATLFFDWMQTFNPTWYTAVPSMHQSILARAEKNKHIIENSTFRFIRSSSSPLPPQVMQGLENGFHAPVIESYGMTEAAHQMASNPLPPLPRKPGSVGIAAGPEVAVMDDKGNILEACTTGELVIRGQNVTPGYENNEQANQSSFTNGWFCTGDQGYMDKEGYFYLTGRLKEIINRGGEKISPREVDEVILQHPAVAQVVTFAMPHATLGEDVAAAVVLKENMSVSEIALKEFTAGQLSEFKVPGIILFLDEIPKGPTGKLQRIGLAEKLGLVGKPVQSLPSKEYVAPVTVTQEKLSVIWSEVLKIEKVSIHDNFLEIGGDSLLATKILARVRNIFGSDIPYVRFFSSPTIASQSEVILESQKSQPEDDSMSDLLTEIGNLSEEEVMRLLEAARSNNAPD